VKSTTVARNYAEALVLAAEASGGAKAIERFGELLDAVAGAVRSDERIAVALESPRVAKATKADLLERALAGAAPGELVRFLQAVVRRGRQGLLDEISSEYQGLVDLKLNRVLAGVTAARPLDEKLQQEIVTRLQKALGKDVRAHFRTDEAILGGVVVRVGDRVYDGSVRRRLTELRRRLLGAG
jgi:F-type H+-transporting ATPase subunit delta